MTWQSPDIGYGWRVALAVSLVLHSVVLLLLSRGERLASESRSEPTQILVRLAALSPKSPAVEPLQPLLDASDPIAPEATPADPAPAPAPSRTATVESMTPLAEDPLPETTLPETTLPETTLPEEPPATAPTVDWQAEMARAVVVLRDKRAREATYFAFNYPSSRTESGTGGLGEPRSAFSQNSSPGEKGLEERTVWGDARHWVSDDCYILTSRGSLWLEEAHRFSNTFTTCETSTAADTRGDLFADLRPAYLR